MIGVAKKIPIIPSDITRSPITIFLFLFVISPSHVYLFITIYNFSYIVNFLFEIFIGTCIH